MAASKTKSKPLIDPEDLLTRDDIEFEDFLDELGPEIATVSIFRVLRDGSREHVDKVPLSELIADVYGWLRDQCGIGKYQLYFRGEDKRYRGAKTVSVGERKVNGAAPATAGTNGHHDWMEKQLTMQQTMITGMLSAMKGPDVGTLLQGVAALAPKPAVQPDPSVMLTAVATVFATLRGPQKDEDWLTRAKTIIELAKDLQPEDRGGDTGWTVVKDVGKAVVDKLGVLEPKAALPAAEHTRTVTVPVNGRSPNGDAASHPSEIPAETPRTMPQNAADWIRVALGYLKEKAKLFKDPEIYVDQIFDNIEEPQNAAIVGAIREGAQFEDLLLFDSEIGENDGYRNWFRKVYDGVHTELFTSMDSARAGGNGSDTSHDARSRTAGQSPS